MKTFFRNFFLMLSTQFILLANLCSEPVKNPICLGALDWMNNGNGTYTTTYYAEDGRKMVFEIEYQEHNQEYELFLNGQSVVSYLLITQAINHAENIIKDYGLKR